MLPTLDGFEFNQRMKMLELSSVFISPYTATILRLDTTICSGVFVKICGVYGVLTAKHCADLIFDKPRVAFAFYNQPHQAWIDTDNLGRIELAVISDGKPDLSFIAILDNRYVQGLMRYMAFYDLEEQDGDVLRSRVLKDYWCICGSPHEKLVQ
ncbi:MAG TPA: hypothetical protein VK742_19715 [Candidatus Sulfotelmatobacter sp.]|nr:hypothetical protein [Candidatus Sulfotelmatobacter sp.]